MDYQSFSPEHKPNIFRQPILKSLKVEFQAAERHLCLVTWGLALLFGVRASEALPGDQYPRGSVELFKPRSAEQALAAGRGG